MVDVGRSTVVVVGVVGAVVDVVDVVGDVVVVVDVVGTVVDVVVDVVGDVVDVVDVVGRGRRGRESSWRSPRADELIAAGVVRRGVE